MRKITYLLSLFLMMVGTAMAQTYVTPGTEKVLTSENLRALTTETPIILCPVQKDMYGQWYDGNSSTTYATSGTTVTEANVFVWVPILNGEGAATGTGYLKKRTAEDDAAYLQTSNITTFGAQSSAQVFYPVTPVNSTGTGNATFKNGNIVSGYTEANLVRLVCGSSEGTTWFNFNGRQYNSGDGIWTAMEVRNASDIQTVATHTIGKAIVSADDLRAGYKYLIRNISASRSGYVYVDAAATSENLKTSSISGNSFGNEYVFTAEAAEGGVYLKANNGEYIPSATGGNLNTSATAAVVTVAYKGGNYPKTTLNLMVNGNYCNVNPGKMCVWNDVNDVNGVWEIIPVDASDFVTVSVKGQLNANNSQTVDMGVIGSSNYLPNQWAVGDASGYDYIAAGEAVQLADGAAEVTVPFTENMPFVASASFADAKWYMVNMHSNESNYMWTATATDGTPALTVVNKGSVYKETAAPDDTRLWCFIGNAWEGFKIYNKAVGSAYTMNKTTDGDNAVSWGEAATGTCYLVKKTASSYISGGFCFLPIGHSYYLNHRQPNIQGWTARDEGSTCLVYAPDAFLLNYAADIVAGPANSLGTAKYFNTEGKFDNFNNVIDAANADHFNATATANLAALLTEYAADEANATTNEATITAGYYRLMNYKYKNYMTSGLNGSDNSLWGGLSAAEAPGTAGTIVKVVADESNYKLYVQGLEVGQMTDASARLNLTGGGVFTIANTGNKYTFMDVSLCEEEPSYPNHRAIHQASDNRIVGWETGADATKWYVIPATTLDLPLNVVGDKTYATTYLPFGVTLPDDGSVKAYIVTLAESEKATVSEVADIPANQGVVLVGQSASATKATLTLGTASADCTDNLLSGTNPRRTIEDSEKTNYYIFGNGGNGVGFYHPNSTTLKENRAFLPASVVTVSGSVNGFKLDFGGVNTGIEAAIQADEANATYYDLSGRRVIRPAKGIYVKNGRKVYVK